MKTKVVLFFVTAVIAIAGVGAWFAFRPNAEMPSSGQHDDAVTPAIQLNITADSLAKVQDSRSLQVAIKTDGYNNIARVEYLIDGKLFTYSTQSPFEVNINVSTLEPGEHTLQAIAYGVKGGTSKSGVFTFTLSEDKQAEPSNPESESTVRQSVSQQALKKIASSGSNGSGDTGSGSGNPGDGGGPTTPPDTTPWPDAPPAQICGNTSLLSGPSIAPAGAVVVPAGNNGSMNLGNDNTIYWFAPGVHTLNPDEFGQIEPGSNSTYVGAPGAILDGNGINKYSFTQHATNVKIQYLTIQNFVTPRDEGNVNHDSGVGWTMEYLTVQNNGGGAVFAGTHNTIRYSCLKDNGQYGFQVYSGDAGGPQYATLDHNEIVGNNTDDWETQIGGCGCTGGGKFWEANHVDVTNNYVHDNLSVGLWADTNDNDFLVENNYIEGNHGQGLFYEVSYNMVVRNNNFIGNAQVGGPGNPGFPTGAIYLSESGGDSRVAARTDKIDIYDNNFDNNWSGVILWENADRFCSSPANTSSGTCTAVNPAATLATCTDPANGGMVNVEPYKSDCRWKTQNVSVHNNTFKMDRSAIAGCAINTGCGFNGIFSNFGTFPSWSPYMGSSIQTAITYNQNNHFLNNTYVGDWDFRGFTQSNIFNFAFWQLAPYSQDTGSTYNGEDHLVITNAVDTDTATLEGSVGQWRSWFNSTPTRSNEQAHTGTYSLKVGVSDPFWGVNLADTNGFPVTPGKKTVSFWGKQGSGTMNVGITFRWLNSSHAQLSTTSLAISPVTSSWQQATTEVTPPVGATSVDIQFAGSNGSNGNWFYIDDVVVADAE